MKLTKNEYILLEEHFRIYEDDQGNISELEIWTNGGVDQTITFYEDDNSLIERFEQYINNFDIDEEIEMYRQDQLYKDNFTIRESVADFEEYLEKLKDILKQWKELKENEK